MDSTRRESEKCWEKIHIKLYFIHVTLHRVGERAWEVDSVLRTSNEESKELTTWEWKLMNPQWLLFCFIERSKVFQFFFFIIWTFSFLSSFTLCISFVVSVFVQLSNIFVVFHIFFLLCSKENSIFFYNFCLV